jgi:hypothetical protein
MIAAMVVPLGRRSIASTVSCFEDRVFDGSGGAGFGVSGVFDLVGAFEVAGAHLLVGRFLGRLNLRVVFTDFGFDLVVAIGFILVSTTAS